MDPGNRKPMSQAVRELRKGLGGISQQELAFRLKMAVRTIARWEADQPPRGTALLRIAELAREQNLNEIAGVFRRALEDELVIGGAAVDPDIKPWLQAVYEIFRWRDHAPPWWDQLTSTIIEGIRHIEEVSYHGVPNARLKELLATITVGAMLPAERELKRLAEEIAAREGLAYGAAFELAKERNPPIWSEYLQQHKNRAEDRRQHNSLWARKDL